jgi:hypothetical protein
MNVQIEQAARMPRSVTTKRRRKIAAQALEIAALREELARKETIIQTAMAVLLKPWADQPHISPGER